jgi:hypothetical protein
VSGHSIGIPEAIDPPRTTVVVQGIDADPKSDYAYSVSSPTMFVFHDRLYVVGASGEVRIRFTPAAALVRHYAEQFPRAAATPAASGAENPDPALTAADSRSRLILSPSRIFST